LARSLSKFSEDLRRSLRIWDKIFEDPSNNYTDPGYPNDF